MPHDVEREALTRYLEEHNLKQTKQREAILDVFLEVTGHISSDELFQRVRARHPHIGFTTVYRTMKILCEAGLAIERQLRRRPDALRDPARAPRPPRVRALRARSSSSSAR